MLLSLLPVTRLCRLGGCFGRKQSKHFKNKTQKNNPPNTHTQSNNNHATAGHWVGWRNEVSSKKVESLDEGDKTHWGRSRYRGTPTSWLWESNWVLMVRCEKHLEVYRIYFATATPNPACPYLLKLSMREILKIPLVHTHYYYKEWAQML